MPPREDDDVAPRPAAPSAGRLLIPLGCVLATLGTLIVFLTEDAQYLRIAVVAVAWAFVLATLAASRRSTDRVAAAAREAEIRQAYEHELDREVAARREYELDLEHELRREAGESMRYELDALRGDIAALSGLRDEVARVSELRGDLAELSGLRDDVARVAALRDDVAALMALRQDLGQLGELRAEMGRLRAELTEQLSSEMLVERIVMRTQASRIPGEPARLEGASGRTLEGRGWADDAPPRELTGGWPAVRLDEPRETRQFEEVRVDRSGQRPPEQAPDHRPWDAPLSARWDAPADTPATSAWPLADPPFAEEPRYRLAADQPPGPPPTTMSPIAPSSIARPPAPAPAPPPPVAPAWEPPATKVHHVRRPLDRPPVPPPVAGPPSPLAGSPSPLDGPSRRPAWPDDARWARDEVPQPTTSRPEVPRTAHRPVAPPPVRADDRGGYRVAVPDDAPATAPGSAREKRLADILAENGVSPDSGGRRRRRYRDEDEPDDVLARVLRDG